MTWHFLFFILLLLTYNSCRQHNNLTVDKKNEIIMEIKEMMTNYYDDIKTGGLLAEFKYLDSSNDFSWIPPGYSTGISYDSVANILKANSGGFKSVVNRWYSLEILPITENLVTYSGRINSRVIDTSGKITNTDLLESGTIIKRKDGWKLLKGRTTFLPQKNESEK